MEFVDGETLENLIRRFGRLEPNMALEIVAQVAAGLAAIQKQHLIHRDIKPSNIMVGLDEGRLETVKIIDLGLAKGAAEEDTISTTGSFTGTPGYSSPEQFAGLGTDVRSDLYSLGVTLWEMLVGEVPFQGSAAELMYQHQHVTPPLETLKGLPAPVTALLEVLLEKDPGRRFQGPAQLLKVLPRVREAVASRSRLTGKELRSVSDKAIERSPKAALRKRAFRWLLAAGLGSAGLLVGLFFIGHRGPFFNQRSAHAAPPEKSIAVLPFENIGANKDETYFADGVQSEILSKLAKVAQLKVISRTSVMAYRPPNKEDVRSIAGALNVTYIVEGTVQREGNQVRITTELIDARKDKTVWSESYKKGLTDMFAVQGDIAQTVASKLSARLSPEEQKDIAEQPTTSLEAYDLYLQAQELVAKAEWGENGRDKFLKAISLLEEATRKDPKFVLAYCLAARAHDNLYHYWLDKTPARLALADAAVDEAVRLEPDRPEVHLAVAYHLYSCYRNYDRASVQIAMAQRGLPNSAEALWLAARIDRRQGRWDESTKALERAYNLDPRNVEILYHLAINYDVLHRFPKGDEISDRLSELEPENPLFKQRRAWVAWIRKADPTTYRAALDSLPSSRKDHGHLASIRFRLALYTRDWSAAAQILSTSSDEDLYFGESVMVAAPRGCGAIWLAALQGKHPTTEAGYGSARDQLEHRVEANPEEAELLSVLGLTDAFLGRKEEAIREATRAVGIRPISQDALEGAWILENLAKVYAWTNEADLAFRELASFFATGSVLICPEITKADPIWDPIRKDPRFEKLFMKLSPGE
jgi:TolB-like protein/Flp pilus assembly protein TadD